MFGDSMALGEDKTANNLGKRPGWAHVARNGGRQYILTVSISMQLKFHDNDGLYAGLNLLVLANTGKRVSS